MRSDRYSTEHEIKSILKNISETSGGGPVLWVDPDTKDVYVLDSESHVIFLGQSGTGKTRRGTISMIRAWIASKESYIVVDPKGDLREATICFAKAADYDTLTFNYRDINQSVGFNMLALPYELYKSGEPSKQQLASEMIDNLAESIFQHTGENDPYWIDSARSLFTGAIYILFEFGSEDQINIPNVYRLISEGQDRVGDCNYLNKLCKNRPDEVYSMLLQHVCSAPRETLGSIYSVTYQGMSLFIKNKGIAEMTSSNEFKISSLDGVKPIAIYLVTPDETGVYSSISGIIINQLTTHLIKLAHDKFSGRLPRRVNLLVEELGNIGGAIPNLDHIMSAGRSRNLRTAIVLQSLSQLQDIYGRAKATTIISNADALIAYRTNNWETLEELSKKCGEREIDYGKKNIMEPLLTPTQIGAMETGQCLCIISGRIKFISWLPDYTEIFDMSNWTPPENEEHERSELSKTFSISDIVIGMERDRIKEQVEKDIEEFKRKETLVDKYYGKLEKNSIEDLLNIEFSDEEKYFSRILRRRRNRSSNIAEQIDKKYYEVEVSNYSKSDKKDELLIRANRHRIIPISTNQESFCVYFGSGIEAKRFIKDISGYSCKIFLSQKEFDETEE